ncbi:MAG: type II toxin-antitoxin system HicB family antitoxin [Patescibacteria group bacterium]|nr:type II toxin-antitoxin system HicB family antitoxin [Patescibacteria group bacterium]
MAHIIQFQITKGEDGYYVASAEREAIFTQAKTFEELLKNIKEAVETVFGDLVDATKKAFPPVMMSMDLSELSHA